MAKTDISLVNMPNFPVIYPSLSLSLLKAILRESGIKSKIIYGNLLSGISAEMILPEAQTKGGRIFS
jgi:hypothetical protein